MENNKNKKSVKFQGDMLNFCDFIQVFVFTRNHHLKVNEYSSICSYIYKSRYLCDFLFASLGVTALPKGDLLLNERIFYDGSIFVPLTLKAPNENCSRQHFIFFYFYLSKEIRLDFSCERIHMKYQVLFSLKSYEKVFIYVVCCSRDCPFKG